MIITSTIWTAGQIKSDNLYKGLSPGAGPVDKGPGKSGEGLLLLIVVIIKAHLLVGASAWKKVPKWKKRDAVSLGLCICKAALLLKH